MKYMGNCSILLSHTLPILIIIITTNIMIVIIVTTSSPPSQTPHHHHHHRHHHIIIIIIATTTTSSSSPLPHHHHLLKQGVTDFHSMMTLPPSTSCLELPHLDQTYCFVFFPRYMSFHKILLLPFPLIPSTSIPHALFTGHLSSSTHDPSASIHFSLPLPPQFLPDPTFP